MTSVVAAVKALFSQRLENPLPPSAVLSECFIFVPCQQLVQTLNDRGPSLRLAAQLAFVAELRRFRPDNFPHRPPRYTGAMFTDRDQQDVAQLAADRLDWFLVMKIRRDACLIAARSSVLLAATR